MSNLYTMCCTAKWSINSHIFKRQQPLIDRTITRSRANNGNNEACSQSLRGDFVVFCKPPSVVLVGHSGHNFEDESVNDHLWPCQLTHTLLFFYTFKNSIIESVISDILGNELILLGLFWHFWEIFKNDTLHFWKYLYG